jgi:hypothetical protein
MSSFNNFLDNTIMLDRNRNEELNCNFTKIYDLSKIDSKENLSFEQKQNILITIKKILLSTNLYFYTNFFSDLITSSLKTVISFLFFILVYTPLYKAYFYQSEEKKNPPNGCPFYQKLLCFFIFWLIDRKSDIPKVKEIKKIMNFYAQSIVIERNNNKEINDNLMFVNEDNLTVFIIKKNVFYGRISYPNIDIEKVNKCLEDKFYQYVINYPNNRNFFWDRKILNEKENEIANDIISAINSTENILFIKYSFKFIANIIFFILSCNNFIEGNSKYGFIYRYCEIIVNLIVSILKEKSYKSALLEKEILLSLKYIPYGYFIRIDDTIIQIFKLNDEYADNTFNVEDTYKKILNKIDNLNENIV